MVKLWPPGVPFWSGLAAFAADMIALIGVGALDVTTLAVQVTWLGALIVSSFAGIVVYAKAKADEVAER